jgi:hypothetical protein
MRVGRVEGVGRDGLGDAFLRGVATGVGGRSGARVSACGRGFGTTYCP